MAIPSQQKQPLFLSSSAAALGQYVAIAADFVTPTDVLLNRGIYCLTAVDVDITFALDATGALDGTNGAHIPAGDTRVLYVETATQNLTMCLAPGDSTAGSINIAQQRSIPERF